MARELSQEAVLDFLWAAGGRAPNTALLRHFQRFLRDPALTEQQRRERREYFKSLVNSLATVHPAAAPGASKDIVLRRRYRDLLDEELPPPGEEEEKEPSPSPPRRDLGPRGEAAGKGRPGGERSPGGCAARGGRGGPCCECRRARRAAACAAAAAAPPAPGPAHPPPPPPAQPPPYRTRPLSSALHLNGPARSRPPELPSGPGALIPTGPSPHQTPQPPSARPPRSPSPPLPPAGSAPSGSRAPQRAAAQPPARCLLLPPGPEVLPHDRLPQPRSPPQTRTGMPLPAARPSYSPQLSSIPRVLSPADPSLSRSLPLLSAPEVLPPSRSLQAPPASSSPSPPLVPGPAVLPSTRLPPSQSRSLQHLPTRPSPSLPRGAGVLSPNGPTHSPVLLLHPHQSLLLLPGPGAMPSTGPPPPSQSPPQFPTQPPPSRSQQPPPARSPPSPVLGPQAPASGPPAPLPVFRSIRCQLALLEARGTPCPAPDARGRQLCALPGSRSSPRNAAGRVPSVPLGKREHSWLVAVTAGRWARVRGLFLEEPELALQRDFISGFTVLHWLAKHGDGPGLQELAAEAQRAGLALDVDARSGCGYTPLHLAAIHGHQPVIKVLVLQLGCRVQLRDSSGRQPWEYLGGSTSGEIWQLLEAPRGTIMFPTQPLALSGPSDSGGSPPTSRAVLPTCLRPRLGERD